MSLRLGRLPGSFLGSLGAAAAALFFFIWEVAHRGSYDYTASIYPISDADEWRYTACSKLVLHGYTLFSQVFSAQPPVFFATLAAGMRLFGDSVAGARWTEICFGLVALGATAWLAAMLDGPIAAVAAAATLAISPGFLVYFHTIEAEGPMMALAALALALLVYAKIHGSLIACCAAGLVLASAILVKLFAVEVVLPAGWIVLVGMTDQKSRLRARHLLGLVICLCTPLGIDFGLFHRTEQWDQVVTLHSKAANAHLSLVTPSSDIFHRFANMDVGLIVLASAGCIVVAIGGRWADLGFLVLWAGGTVGMLAVFHPLFPHHLAVLLAPLGCCASMVPSALAHVHARLIHACRLLALSALAAYIALLPRSVHDDRHVLVPQSRPQVMALGSFVRRMTSPSGLVAVDDLQVAEVAGRLVAPPLCDPSNVRLQAGYLTTDTVIGALTRYHVVLALPSFGIYAQVPGVIPWLLAHYRTVTAPGNLHAYLRR